MRKEYDFSTGRRGAVIAPRRGKTRITIRLDDDLLEWFRSRVDAAGGGSYQTLINDALRKFIAKDSEQNAALVARRILQAVELLQTHPEIGRPGRVLGTRELVVPDTPYIIPYRVRRERVELIAVFHGHQKWPSKL